MTRRALLLLAAGALAACRPAGPAPESAAGAFRSGQARLRAEDPAGAARLFHRAREVARTGPDSALAHEAGYWEAFALFRVGDAPSLGRARRVLAGIGLGRPGVDDPDASDLELRILARLAGDGDPGSAAELAGRADSLLADCASGDPYARALALAGLLRAEPSDGRAAVERALTGGQCPAAVRHNALYVLPPETGADGAALLDRVARADPDPSVRADAAMALQRFADHGGLGRLLALYDAAGGRGMKEQLIVQYALLDDPAGAARLREIARDDPVAGLRRMALAALAARRLGVAERLFRP